jgi:hypothetical protein
MSPGLFDYFGDPVYALMSVTMQTWTPYEIQITINDREWLRRSLGKAGCSYYEAATNSCTYT